MVLQQLQDKCSTAFIRLIDKKLPFLKIAGSIKVVDLGVYRLDGKYMAALKVESANMSEQQIVHLQSIMEFLKLVKESGLASGESWSQKLSEARDEFLTAVECIEFMDMRFWVRMVECNVRESNPNLTYQALL